jgi:ribosome biogenesis GTPase / thiamine phosphate phosphatase
MAKKKNEKIRADFRKNRNVRTRQNDLTKDFDRATADDLDSQKGERVSGKGELTRKRVIVGEVVADDDGALSLQRDVDKNVCLEGRVLRVMGLLSDVRAENGRLFRCATRRLLKTMSTDQRHVVATGDRVWFRPEGTDEGIIERVEPRHGILSRTSRNRQHILVTNVDQVLIVGSAAEPYLKPNLIDRFLVTAERMGVRPIICINKVDLVDAADLQPLIGVYSQIGYRVLPISVRTGQGVDRVRKLLAGRQSVVSGQSGVGKSSLLNCLEPGLGLHVREVSVENQKGKHTTTTATLIPLGFGGYVVDTPGIRQFQLWDVSREEVAAYYRDLRPYVSKCRYPNCSHRHETDCAVKDAVADGRIDTRRYESYVHLYEGEME